MNEAIEVLRRYSLVRRNAETKLLSIHRLVQAVLINAMKEEDQRLWAERAVRAANSVFPGYDAWLEAERYLLQVPVCVPLLDRYGLAFPEAADLFYEAGYYWYQHAEYEQAEPTPVWSVEGAIPPPTILVSKPSPSTSAPCTSTSRSKDLSYCPNVTLSAVSRSPERSEGEGSVSMGNEMLRCTQDDRAGGDKTMPNCSARTVRYS